MIQVGDTYGDFDVIHDDGRKWNHRYFTVKCKICGCEKSISDININQQDMSHSKFNCRNNYYQTLIGKMYGDYIITDYVKDGAIYKVKLKCTICGHEKLLSESALELSTLTHNGNACHDDYYKNLIGKRIGDFEIMSLNRKEKSYVYFNVRCVVCGTMGIKSSRSLEKHTFKHGSDCLQMIPDSIYKDAIMCRYHDIYQRCNNPNHDSYEHYGGRGIKLEYDSPIDLYNDFINDLIEHSKVYGLDNSTFDRIDVNGNYCKENLRIATQSIQSANTTRKKLFILSNGKEIVLCDNAMEFGRVYNVNGRSVGNVVRKKSKRCGDWNLVEVFDNSVTIDEILNQNKNITKLLITT